MTQPRSGHPEAGGPDKIFPEVFRVSEHPHLMSLAVPESYKRKLTPLQALEREKYLKKRGKVKGRTARSASRVQQLVRKIARPDIPLAVTLTTRRCDGDAKQHYLWLDALLAVLRRAYPGLCGIWAKEYQKRGAAHYHLALWFPGTPANHTPFPDVVEDFTERCREAWLRIVGETDDPAAQVHAVDVRPADNCGSWCGYVAGHAAKCNQQADGDLETGRTWAVIGRKFLELEPLSVMELTLPQYWRFRRITRRMFKQQYDAWRVQLVEKVAKLHPAVAAVKLRDFDARRQRFMDTLYMPNPFNANLRLSGYNIHLLKPHLMKPYPQDYYGPSENPF